MNLLVIDIASLHGLSDWTRLFGLLLEDLERVGDTAEAAVRSSITSHRESVDDVVNCCLRLVK